MLFVMVPGSFVYTADNLNAMYNCSSVSHPSSYCDNIILSQYEGKDMLIVPWCRGIDCFDTEYKKVETFLMKSDEELSDCISLSDPTTYDQPKKLLIASKKGALSFIIDNKILNTVKMELDPSCDNQIMGLSFKKLYDSNTIICNFADRIEMYQENQENSFVKKMTYIKGLLESDIKKSLITMGHCNSHLFLIGKNSILKYKVDRDDQIKLNSSEKYELSGMHGECTASAVSEDGKYLGRGYTNWFELYSLAAFTSDCDSSLMSNKSKKPIMSFSAADLEVASIVNGPKNKVIRDKVITALAIKNGQILLGFAQGQIVKMDIDKYIKRSSKKDYLEQIKPAITEYRQYAMEGAVEKLKPQIPYPDTETSDSFAHDVLIPKGHAIRYLDSIDQGRLIAALSFDRRIYIFKKSA